MNKLIIMLFIAVIASAAGCGELSLGKFSPAAPTNLTAVSSTGTNGTGQILLTWNPSKGTTLSQGATFNIYRGTAATGVLADKTLVVAGIAATTYLDTYPASNVIQYYQVTATIYNMESGGSNEAIVAQQGQVPSDNLFTLTGSSSASVNNLSWSALPGASGYTVYKGMTPGRSLSDKIAGQFINADAVTTALTDKDVSVGLTYYYQVAARYPDIQFPTSNEIAVTTR